MQEMPWPGKSSVLTNQAEGNSYLVPWLGGGMAGAEQTQRSADTIGGNTVHPPLHSGSPSSSTAQPIFLTSLPYNSCCYLSSP